METSANNSSKPTIDEKSRDDGSTSDSSSSSSDKRESLSPKKRQDGVGNGDRRDRSSKNRDHIRRRRSRSNSGSSDDNDHRHRKHSHRHRDSSKRSHHRRHRRHSSRERRRSRSRSRSSKRRRHSSSGRRSRSPRNSGDERRSESRRKRSRSRGESRSHRRSSRERHHRSSRHRRSRSPRRSRRNGLNNKVEADKAKGADDNDNSVSSHRKRSWSRSPSPPTGYDRAMDAQERLARRLERARDLMRRKAELNKKEREDDARRVSGLSPLDKVQEAAKRASQILSEGSAVKTTTPDGISAVATAQIEALKAKALAETGIEVPSYYNPLAVNPMSYAQQAMKRKMLWSKKDDDEKDKDKSTAVVPGKTALWSGVKFGDDKSNEKFAKLMGIKGDQAKGPENAEANAIIKKQAEVFQNLDMQYQQARITTHTQRGLGLGFSSSMIDPNAAAQQPTSTG